MDSTGSVDSLSRSTGAAFTTEEVKQKLAKAGAAFQSAPQSPPASVTSSPGTPPNSSSQQPNESPRFHSRFLPGGKIK